MFQSESSQSQGSRRVWHVWTAELRDNGSRSGGGVGAGHSLSKRALLSAHMAVNWPFWESMDGEGASENRQVTVKVAFCWRPLLNNFVSLVSAFPPPSCRFSVRFIIYHSGIIFHFLLLIWLLCMLDSALFMHCSQTIKGGCVWGFNRLKVKLYSLLRTIIMTAVTFMSSRKCTTYPGIMVTTWRQQKGTLHWIPFSQNRHFLCSSLHFFSPLLSCS